jgi:hypothetical protein
MLAIFLKKGPVLKFSAKFTDLLQLSFSPCATREDISEAEGKT